MSSSEDDANFVPIKIKRRRRAPIDTEKLEIPKIFTGIVTNEMKRFDASEINKQVAEELAKNEKHAQRNKSSSCKEKSNAVKVIYTDSSDDDNYSERPPTPPPVDIPERARPTRRKSNRRNKSSDDILENFAKVITQPALLRVDLNESRESDCEVEESYDDIEGQPIAIGISFRQQVHNFFIPERKPCSYLYDRLSEKVGVVREKLHISCCDRKVLDTDIPTMFGDDLKTLFECVEKEVKPNTIEVHLQSQKLRSKRTYTIEETAPLKSVFIQYCGEVMKTSLEKLVFKFDDENLNWDLSAKEQDIEDGMCIDVIEKS